MLDILTEAGYLKREETDWEVIQSPGPEMEPKRLAVELQGLLSCYPESRGQLTFTGQCGEALSRVLTRQRGPAFVIIPQRFA